MLEMESQGNSFFGVLSNSKELGGNVFLRITLPQRSGRFPHCGCVSGVIFSEESLRRK